MLGIMTRLATDAEIRVTHIIIMIFVPMPRDTHLGILFFMDTNHG